MDRYDDTDLMHRTHIAENKIECNQCHLDIQHKISRDVETISDCRTCHTDFHKAQKILYAGQGGEAGAHPIPNIMFQKGLSCKGCHIFHETSGGREVSSDTLTAQAESCESCHGKGFGRIMREWETSTSQRLALIKRIYRSAQDAVRASRSPGRPEAEKLLREASFNIDVVERGKAVHNVEYSQELLGAAYRTLNEALKTVGSSVQLEAFVTQAKGVPGQCSVCHSGIVDISVPIYGLRFPHQTHVVENGTSCGKCHSNARTHGELILSRQDCAACHHVQPENKDCARCHILQKAFYQGGEIQDLEIPRDMMAEAGVACQDCHTDDEGKIFRSDGSRCVVCHEEGYDEMLGEWQSNVSTLLDSVKTALQEARAGDSGQDRDRIEKIRRILRSLEEDGSRGGHNSVFYEETLTGLKKEIESGGKGK